MNAPTRYALVVVSKLDNTGQPIEWAIDNVIEAEEQPAAEYGDWRPCGNSAGPRWILQSDGKTFLPPNQ